MIANIYRPPQGNYKEGCRLLSSAFERSNFRENTDFFVLGDFNIDFRDTKSPAFKELNFTMRMLGLEQLVKSPTRTAFRQGIASNTTTDLIFTNSEIIKETQVLDSNLSDHLAVCATRKKTGEKRVKIDFKGRSYKHYVKEDFQQGLVDHNWDEFYRMNNPNILWQYMQGVILRLINPMCPVKTFKVFKARNPWITNEALEAIRDKDCLLNRAKKTGKEEDWTRARQSRNTVGRDIKLLRIDFLKTQQETHKADPKKFWKTLASIVPGKKKFSGDIWLKDKSTGARIEQSETAETMNSFFTNIGKELARKHTAQWSYFGETVEDSIGEMRTDTEEVRNLCKDIETLKSSGIDELSSRICKDAFLVLSDQLTFLFNCSLREGIFPDVWKAAKVVPIFKGGDSEEVGNYRPVSLLPLPGKILEKIVHKRFSMFLEENKFLTKNQGGFRKGFSTISTIADLTDDIFDNINIGQVTTAAFIDLQKAFDTVNLSILMSKLKKAGIRSAALKWCDNYLSGRSQHSCVNGHVSTSLQVTCGVPQGSVLGPLLFLVYINDLEFALDECRLKLYADDTVLYHPGINVQDSALKLQKSLDRFCVWAQANKLSINVKKSKLMVFGSRSAVKKANNVRIYMQGSLLQRVPTFKYLGTVLDPTLNFTHHLDSAIRIVTHKMTLLAKLKRYLNNSVAIQIYKSMILPYLDYADVIFHNTNVSHLDKLQRLQNRCLRICSGWDRMFSTDRAHKLSNVPFLKDRRKAHVLNFMYNRKSRPELMNVREIRTRAHNAPMFNVTVPRCEAFKRSVGYSGSVDWNNLPPNLRNTDGYLAFKAHTKKEMLRPLSAIQI